MFNFNSVTAFSYLPGSSYKAVQVNSKKCKKIECIPLKLKCCCYDWMPPFLSLSCHTCGFLFLIVAACSVYKYKSIAIL